MMITLFADTHYFLALLSPSDEGHARAVAFTKDNEFRLVTTPWVLTELADALAASAAGRAEFLATADDLRSDPDATIVPCDDALIAKSIQLYGERLDKQWSLTDCISFIVMTAQGLSQALTADHHFEQAGFVALLK
jgi:predicted nucleic acid-binding protein